jgi:NADH:ubiquinone oxidoreductase subunit 5 (subunit L)/multisubunit Na+/H+ antiporter MnhA subunit
VTEIVAVIALLIPLAPLVAASTIAFRILRGQTGGDGSELASSRSARRGVTVALLLLLTLDAMSIWSGTPGAVRAGSWFASGNLDIPLSFLLDTLSLSIGTWFALLAWFAIRFAVNYLHREPGFHRFMLAIGLFTSGMLWIVLSGNAVTAFAGWELAGISSWMLIGYAYERDTATVNALRAFVTNRVGDAGFMLAIAAAFTLLGSVDWLTINAATESVGLRAAGLIAIGFVLAAFAKSAQVPFSPWIARALEGPTPSSAIFYGALLVHAGVYLILRLQDLFMHEPALSALLVIAGMLTALYGWLSGMAQTDAKSTLMFATTTQTGIMFIECGLGFYTLAAWHMGLHATLRTYQFLTAPSRLHALDAPPRSFTGPLARCTKAYTAARERFWVEPITDWLWVRPTLALARDLRHFDEQVVSRFVGSPGGHAQDQEVVHGRGAAGAGLNWIAARLHRIEEALLLQEGGAIGRLLRPIGDYLRAVESLLEQPRYLLLVIMATFVAVL